MGNIKVGLPFVRVGVDHGTAFDTAGMGRANHSSLLHTLHKASDLMPAKEIVRRRALDFIFMLTRADRTIEDAQEKLVQALSGGITHIGFKDVGLPSSELRKLAMTIRAAGATSYLEVVSLDLESEMKSANLALELGLGVLMGGVHPEAVIPIISGSRLRYFPFVGRVGGIPSVLSGSISEIVDDAIRVASMKGVSGIDLLAYRSMCDGQNLILAVCRAVDKPVIVAGSIDRPNRVQAARLGGAAAFTVGTAALDGKFPAAHIGLIAQLEAIKVEIAGAWPL